MNLESSSFLRQYENLLSCFSTLFGVEEFKIQEDVLQISELVNTENHFWSRSWPFDPTNKNKTFLKDFFRFWNFDLSNPACLPFFTEYRGCPAVLSEEIEESEEMERSAVYLYLHALHFFKHSNLVDKLIYKVVWHL